MKFGAAFLLPVTHYPEPAEDNVLLVEVEVIVQRAVIVATVVRDSGAPFNTDSFEVNELLRIGAAACPRRRHDKSVRAPEWSGTLQVARIAARRASFPPMFGVRPEGAQQTTGRKCTRTKQARAWYMVRANSGQANVQLQAA